MFVSGFYYHPLLSLFCCFSSDKAKITSSVPKDLTVVVDHQFNVDFDIQGDPPPSITWKYNGGPLEDREVLVTEEDGKARLVIQHAAFSQSGFYELLVENQGGKDVKDFFLNVIGRKPENESVLNGKI